MAENRRPPETLIASLEALYFDGTTDEPVPIPPEQGWARFDLVPKIRAILAEFEKTYGVPLALVALGRSPERSAELWPKGGGTDGHVVGAAFDVAYKCVRMMLAKKNGREYTDRDLAALIDPIAAAHGFRPLGKSRWPDPSIEQRGDWQHYQSDDYGGARRIGPQAFPSIEAARVSVWSPVSDSYDQLLAFAMKRDRNLA
jgi:hypothetical protein